MSRVKGGPASHARHRKIIKQAAGYYGARSTNYRTAKQAVDKALQYATRDRKTRKRNFRALWIQRINAAVREQTPAHLLAPHRRPDQGRHRGRPQGARRPRRARAGRLRRHRRPGEVRAGLKPPPVRRRTRLRPPGGGALRFARAIPAPPIGSAERRSGGLGMTLQVIGAGFGRTGTDSMREALNILGFGPCHHMFEVTAHPEQKRLWRAMVAGAAPDWDAAVRGLRLLRRPAGGLVLAHAHRGLSGRQGGPDPARQRELVEELRAHRPRVDHRLRRPGVPRASRWSATRIFGGRPLDRDARRRRLRGAQRRGARDGAARAGCSSTISATAGSRSAPISGCRCPTSPIRAATPPASSAPTSTGTSRPAAPPSGRRQALIRDRWRRRRN